MEAKSEAGTFTSVTDLNGIYRFPALNPGRYEISANLQGFTAATSAPVIVEVGKLLKVDLALAVSGIAESVEVTAESPTIDVKQTTAATNLRADAIERLPKGRDFTSLVTMAPGANLESRSGGLSIDGASAAENKFFLDGIDTTNLRTGRGELHAQPPAWQLSGAGQLGRDCARVAQRHDAVRRVGDVSN